MGDPRPFQQATVKKALEVLRGRGSRRFLIADEVGLGKTVVAREIIKRMMESAGDRPLVVVYVCSNLAIAKQNRRSLLKVLPEDERDRASAQVDRLTLLAPDRHPKHPRLHLYTLTPDTSLPTRAGRARTGRLEERALAAVLLKRAFPQARVPQALLRGRVSPERWKREFRDARGRRFKRDYITVFRQSVAQFDRHSMDGTSYVAALRAGLATAALEALQPDLVIMDEFQKFNDLVLPSEADASCVVSAALRGDGSGHRPAVLLLSATPYTMYASRSSTDGEARAELPEIVRFLAQDSKAAEGLEEALLALERRLLRGEHTGPEYEESVRRVRTHLSPYVARTERADGALEHTRAETIPTSPTEQDVRVFAHLSRSMRKDHRPAAARFWSSIPLPMQTMGRSYKSWAEAKHMPSAGAFAFARHERDRLMKVQDWPHHRLRALRKLCPAEVVRLPWLPPTLPWWPLRGPWRGQEGASKVLIFSGFLAVPSALSAMLSYDLETSLLRGGTNTWRLAGQASPLKIDPKRTALVATFLPYVSLAEAVDPVSPATNPGVDPVARAANQIQQKFHLKIGKRSRRPLWEVAAAIEARSGQLAATLAAIRKAIPTKGNKGLEGLRKILNRIEAVDPDIGEISLAQLRALGTIALGGPGTLLYRALSRHWEGNLAQVALASWELAWDGLRPYLDNAWFQQVLARKKPYADAIPAACVDGNLEAVIDEQLYLAAQDGTTGANLAMELAGALGLRRSSVRFHYATSRRHFAMRTHAAVAFSAATGESKDRLRTDDLQRSFNSPFWPHVLTTTSVGQEGLDFHRWCSTLVHWDISGGPVEIEQREGRIQRFAGLAVRREIGRRLGTKALGSVAERGSPWAVLAALADKELSRNSGLEPWWILEGADVRCISLVTPFGWEERRHRRISEQRLLYRLALGQPHPEDVVEALATINAAAEGKVRGIGLSPFFHSEKPQGADTSAKAS